MLRRTYTSTQVLTSSALALGLCVGWALPASALAAPPPQPVDQPAPASAPAPAPVPAPAPGAVQPAAAQPVPTQPGVAPAPVYQPPPPQPVPPSNPNRGLGLVIAGANVFLIPYLITAVSGAIAIDAGDEDIGRPLLIPIGGPFVAASRSESALGTFGLAFVGVVQLAGLGMAVGGGVMLAKSRRGARLSAGPGGLQLEF